VGQSRIILSKLAVVLGVLVFVLGSLYAWTAISTNGPVLLSSYSKPIVTDDVTWADMESEGSETENEEIFRYVIGEHTVVLDESFSLVTGMYWEDIFLWPDLYIRNDMISDDPDLIYPDEIIAIYNRLGTGNVYTDTEKAMILDAYIQVYDRFKALGPKKNSSAWTLLWCGAKYDHNFLDKYAHRIAPEDLAVARRYIEEEGFLD